MTLRYEDQSRQKYVVDSLAESIFDQLDHKPEYLAERFRSNDWFELGNSLRSKGILRVLPATENGFRRVAVEEFAKSAGLEILTIPGSEREMTWERYKSLTNAPDPIDYQEAVADSKHDRVHRLSRLQKEILTVNTLDSMQDRTAMVAFDTVIWTWDGQQYIRREKPLNREEALSTIEIILSGEPFLVSTVASVKSLANPGEVGNAATILPVKIVTVNRFERMALKTQLIELHDQIKAGQAGKWKMTPTGTVSLMHPKFQQFVQVAVTDKLAKNVLPRGFSTYAEVEMPSQHPGYRPTRFINKKHLAYYDFANELEQKGGFNRLDTMTDDLRQQIGMIISGYSEVGMKLAFERYLEKIGVQYSVLRTSRRRSLISGD